MFTKGGPPSLTVNRLRDPAGSPPRPTKACHNGNSSLKEWDQNKGKRKNSSGLSSVVGEVRTWTEGGVSRDRRGLPSAPSVIPLLVSKMAIFAHRSDHGFDLNQTTPVCQLHCLSSPPVRPIASLQIIQTYLVTSSADPCDIKFFSLDIHACCFRVDCKVIAVERGSFTCGSAPAQIHYKNCSVPGSLLCAVHGGTVPRE